mgnify:CR=1 FL=1
MHFHTLNLLNKNLLILLFTNYYNLFKQKEFKLYESMAYAKGFLMVSSSPLTRSSYHASEDFNRMRLAREKSILTN